MRTPVCTVTRESWARTSALGEIGIGNGKGAHPLMNHIHPPPAVAAAAAAAAATAGGG